MISTHSLFISLVVLFILYTILYTIMDRYENKCKEEREQKNKDQENKDELISFEQYKNLKK